VGKKISGPDSEPRTHFKGLESKASGHARRLGLYLVFKNAGALTKWEVYSSATGKWVLDYWPSPCKWRAPNGDVGLVKTCHDMIELADRMVRASTPSSSQESGRDAGRGVCAEIA
jgi:hypothetical protein